MENEPISERVSIALPRSVMARIDAWREAMPVVPARSTAARALIEMALDSQGVPSDGKKPR
jgi:hypothetical protein